MSKRLTPMCLFLSLALTYPVTASATVALCRWAFDQGPKALVSQELVVDIDQPYPHNFQSARAIAGPLRKANGVLGQYLELPKFLRLEFYEGMGQAICSTFRIWANKSVLDTRGWSKSELTVFFHEYGHVMFSVNMTKFFEKKVNKAWNPEQFFSEHLAIEQELDVVNKQIEVAIGGYGKEGQHTPSQQTQFKTELRELLKLRERLRARLKNYDGFDFAAYKESMMFKTKDIQEVFADLVSAIAMRDPTAISKLFPDTFDGIFRNFEMTQKQLEGLQSNPDFVREAATDPHIKSLLRFVIQKELFLDHGKRIGENENHDAKALAVAFEYMTPDMVAVFTENRRWPPGTGPLAVALALKYKTRISEDTILGNLAHWLSEQPGLRQLLVNAKLGELVDSADNFTRERQMQRGRGAGTGMVQQEAPSRQRQAR